MPLKNNVGPKYPANLTKPLSLPPAWSHPAVRPASDTMDKSKRAVAQNFAALFRFYNIDTENQDCWYWLAAHLAANHVRAFQQEKRGNEQVWTPQRLRKLYEDIGAKKSLSARRACDFLARDAAYKDIPAKSNEARSDTLYRRYRDIKSDFAKIEKYDRQCKENSQRPPPLRILDRDPLTFASTAKAASMLVREARENPRKRKGKKGN